MTKTKTIVISPELLKRLKHIAIIESVGASTRLAGSKLSNQEVEKLLAKLKTKTFKNKR